ncbi:SDR family NAD(P)-dependent oxidoreductase [Herbidospora mongoliensis]|uniref:SDR family NAD(P)-dependent oxidoreductase n=1 Tax=Herbidospora mongoliensis TaxID=688067 RepID=UPI001C3F1ED4|nr:SDR family NAD(P)-dependent oxidoreductase [Herbidospora mongoliensis]
MNVVVTGGNRGIGYAVCAELARQGHRVVVVARDAAAGERAVRSLPGEVTLVQGDLSTVAGMWALAERLRSACPEIDVLVHNAGLWPSKLTLTSDGLEEAFAVNHLAPFTLNRLLEGHLKRVVQVSAGLYVKGRADPDRTPYGKDFHPLRTYADTKLCNVLTLRPFAERWQARGLTIDAVHPGVINTGLGARGGPVGLLLKVAKRFWKTPAQGAEPVVALTAKSTSGRYYDERDEIEMTTDPALGLRLWEQAEKLSGVA